MVYKKITDRRKYQRVWVATKRLSEKWDALESKLNELNEFVDRYMDATLVYYI